MQLVSLHSQRSDSVIIGVWHGWAKGRSLHWGISRRMNGAVCERQVRTGFVRYIVCCCVFRRSTKRWVWIAKGAILMTVQKILAHLFQFWWRFYKSWLRWYHMGCVHSAKTFKVHIVEVFPRFYVFDIGRWSSFDIDLLWHSFWGSGG